MKKKIAHRPVEGIVFAPEAIASAGAALDGSTVLRQMLARHPADAFRNNCAASQDAEFWGRCIQVARLEQLALNTSPRRPA